MKARRFLIAILCVTFAFVAGVSSAAAQPIFAETYVVLPSLSDEYVDAVEVCENGFSEQLTNSDAFVDLTPVDVGDNQSICHVTYTSPTEIRDCELAAAGASIDLVFMVEPVIVSPEVTMIQLTAQSPTLNAAVWAQTGRLAGDGQLDIFDVCAGLGDLFVYERTVPPAEREPATTVVVVAPVASQPLSEEATVAINAQLDLLEERGMLTDTLGAELEMLGVSTQGRFVAPVVYSAPPSWTSDEGAPLRIFTNRSEPALNLVLIDPEGSQHVCPTLTSGVACELFVAPGTTHLNDISGGLRVDLLMDVPTSGGNIMLERGGGDSSLGHQVGGILSTVGLIATLASGLLSDPAPPFLLGALGFGISDVVLLRADDSANRVIINSDTGMAYRYSGDRDILRTGHQFAAGFHAAAALLMFIIPASPRYEGDAAFPIAGGVLHLGAAAALAVRAVLNRRQLNTEGW